MTRSVTHDFRDGYQQVAAGLDLEARELLESARGRRSRDRGRSLMAIVLAYREGPREVWGPILLEVLAPALLARLRRLRTEPPVVDDEDIRQQLVMEVLLAAERMPLPTQTSYLRSRLMARANVSMRRWLQRERRRQLSEVSLETRETRQRSEIHDERHGK